MTPTRVTVYSDYVCPFCYMGYASLEQAQQQVPLEISPRAFELRPAGSPPMDPAYRARIEANWPRTQEMGRQFGVAFDAPLNVGVNSRDAHRAAKVVARLAPEQAAAYHSALFRAHFTEGRDIADHDVLVALAEALGVEGTALRTALASDEADDAVQADVDDAHTMGLSGVPALIFDEKYLASGVLPAEQIIYAVQRIQSGEMG